MSNEQIGRVAAGYVLGDSRNRKSPHTIKYKRTRIRRLIFEGIGLRLTLFLLLLTVSFFVNRRLPSESETADLLRNQEKARLFEYYQMRQALGETVWPGWGTADIPVVLYNESYAFLTGYSTPPDGWYKAPQDERRGGPWELVQDSDFQLLSPAAACQW